MTTISDFLTEDHRLCDNTFAAAEKAADLGDWPRAGSELRRFVSEMAAHLGMEEEILFPAFEEATGAMGGPTMMMRMEHRQMRELFDELSAAVEKQDKEAFLGASETLLVLMQQHNMKEENVLYPMTDDALDLQGPELVQRMRTMKSH